MTRKLLLFCTIALLVACLIPLLSKKLRAGNREKELLIVGCARSGTTYMAKLLRASGLRVKHETLGKDGCIAWPMVYGEYASAKPSTDAVPLFRHTFHQVRHPLHTISSYYINFCDLDGDDWRFIRKHLPEISREDSLLVHCAKYWYYWNLKAEEQAEWRYRIEDIEMAMPEFEKRVPIHFNREAYKLLSNQINHWKPTDKKLEWRDLQEALPPDLFQKVQDMAIRYGYEIEQ